MANESVVQVFRKHKGVYECSASNGDGSKEATARINIKVQQSKFKGYIHSVIRLTLYIFILNYKSLCVCVSVMSYHFKISHLNAPSQGSGIDLNIKSLQSAL